MSISEQDIVQQVKGICTQAIRTGKHHDLTVRQVIQTLIDDFKHEPGHLNSKPIKKLIKTTAAESLQPNEESDSNPPPAVEDDSKTTNQDQLSLEEDEEKKISKQEQLAAEEDVEKKISKTSKSPTKIADVNDTKDESDSGKPPSKKRRRISSKGKFKSSEMIDSDGNSIHEQENSNGNNNGKNKAKPATKKPRIKKAKEVKLDDDDTTQETKPTNSDPDPDNNNNESDDKDVKVKPKNSSSSKVKTGKAKKEPVQLDKDEEKIKKLKALVVACGLRKRWKTELKDCSNKKQEILHLNQILIDLGMKGRMSMMQAKEIKARRDLEAEVNELAGKVDSSASADDNDNNNDVHDGSRDDHQIDKDHASSSKKPRKNRTVNDSSDGNSEDGRINKPKTKKNPFAFLGDQGSDDSS